MHEGSSPRYDLIPPWAAATGVVPAVVEIPKGRRSKFEVDKKTGLFKFDR